MKRTLLVAGMVIAAASIALGQRTTTPARDQEALKQVVQELTEAIAQGNIEKLDRLQADEFKGTGGGLSLSKTVLHNALRSGDARVSSWTVNDVQVTVRGNSATVTGRCHLTGATYRGKDYSGDYQWTGRFVNVEKDHIHFLHGKKLHRGPGIRSVADDVNPLGRVQKLRETL